MAIRTDNITDAAGTGAPDFSNGLTLSGGGSLAAFEEIDETLAGGYTGIEGSIDASSVQFTGARIGNTYTLTMRFTYDYTLGNDFDSVGIPYADISFLSGKTVTRIGGTLGNNINAAGSQIIYVQDAPTDINVSFAGDISASQSSRFAVGTIVIKVA